LSSHPSIPYDGGAVPTTNELERRLRVTTVVARWARKTGIAHSTVHGRQRRKTRIRKQHPSDKGTPTARSVRKAEGLEFEIAWLPTKRHK